METYDHQFTNGEITVDYDPDTCIHSEVCARGLNEVFRTSVIPWIHLEGSNTEAIVRQIKKCPSGALRFKYNKRHAQAG